MSSLTLETGALRGAGGLIRAAGRAVSMGSREAIVRAAILGERDLKDHALNGLPPQRRGLFFEGRAQFAMGVRTGTAAASVTSSVVRDGDVWVASAGSPLEYVRTNENGATLRKAGGAIALPTVNALTPSGAPANRFAGLSSLRQARDPGWKRLFVFRGKRRGTEGAWLAGTAGPGAGTVVRGKGGRFKRGGRLVLYFLLRHVVHIPARYMFRNAKRRVEPQVLEETGIAIGVRLEQVFGGQTA